MIYPANLVTRYVCTIVKFCLYIFDFFCFQWHNDKRQISIGYPNVEKRSVINALCKKKVCNSAPLADEIKVGRQHIGSAGQNHSI